MFVKLLPTIIVCLLFFDQRLHAQTPADAKEIVASACNKAKTEDKNVFVIFHASWCYWCHKMDTSMNTTAIKPYFDTSYVIVHIDVNENEPAKKKLETPGGNKLFEQYAGRDPSIPFWVILNASGAVMADSRFSGSDSNRSATPVNIGFPSQPEEIKFFKHVLSKTSSLNQHQIEEIAAVFQKKS